MSQINSNGQSGPPPQAAAPQAAGKGKAFFDRADEVGATGNWDFAIELYLEGIQREPDNFDRGHKPLRNASLNRKLQGGKGPTMMEQFKRRAAKDPLTSLINAEYLLAKEPGSLAYMQQVILAARKLQMTPIVKWMSEIMLEAQKQADKPNKKVLLFLIQTFHDLEEYRLAIQTCDMALKIAPNDEELMNAARELSARYTLKKGKYGQEGGFAKGVKDLEKQQELIEKDRLSQSTDFLQQQIEKARQDYEQAPTVMGKINAYVDALLKIEQESNENQAVEVLRKAYKDTGAYQYKLRIGDITIRQLNRRYHKLVADGDKAGAIEHLKKVLAFELEEYAERAVNYPTDLGVKYELGKRQFLAGRYDDAIASLQQAQRDPRRHLHAMSYLGQAFAKKGLTREAADTFERAIQTEMTEDRAKELRYLLGDALEKLGLFDKAQEQFSQVAQADYTYHDVRERLDAIHKRLSGPGQ